MVASKIKATINIYGMSFDPEFIHNYFHHQSVASLALPWQ